MSEESGPVVEPVEAPAATTENTSEQSEAQAPEPKRRGRPAGSKDTVKRTRKPPVQIRIEPLEAPIVNNRMNPPEQPKEIVSEPKEEVKPKPQPPPEEPKTPRTLLREVSRLHVSLRAAAHDTRKAENAKKYTEKWITLP